MTYVFVADDFTGASDTLATLARAGYRARLFRDVPDPAKTLGLDAFGIATHARSLGNRDMAALARVLGRGLVRFNPRFLHLKVCSTFDSSAGIGNMALLAKCLGDELGGPSTAVIGGQPSLGRHAIFGTLFARGPDGQIHRIDRHPVMSRHPVTPMTEADLLRHLASLGLSDLARVACGAQDAPAFPRFYDIMDQADVAAAGKSLLAHDGPLLVIGASSVAEAWIANHPPRHARPNPPAARQGPVFAFAGSRSPTTTAQIAAASGMSRLPLSPADLAGDAPQRDNALAWIHDRLSRGQDCLVYLSAEASDHSPAHIATASAEFVRDALRNATVAGIAVAGGDTASAVVTALAPDHLDYACDLCPGVPILVGQMRDKPLHMALKGGQMGGADFFDRAAARLGGRDRATPS